MKRFLYILIIALVFDLLYSNSDYYISSYLWKHVNNKGTLCGDNIVFDDSLYIRNNTQMLYYGKGYNGEVVGRYLLCFNFFVESRLWVYSDADGYIGVYRNAIPRQNASFTNK